MEERIYKLCNGLQKFLRTSKVFKKGVSVLMAFALILTSMYFFMPVAQADTITTTTLASNSSYNLSGGTYILDGSGNTLLTNVHVTATSSTTIILKNLNIQLTDNVPFLTLEQGGVGNGQTSAEYVIYSLGDNVIQSTYVNATAPIIMVQNMESGELTIDSGQYVKFPWYYDYANVTFSSTDTYNGTLTLVNATGSTAAVVGASASAYLETYRSGQSYYPVSYSGNITITDNAVVNIVNKGSGPALGGSSSQRVYNSTYATGSDTGTTITVSGGRTYINSLSTGNGIDVSSSNGNIVITSGSLYVDCASGNDFANATPNNGVSTTLYLYEADLASDETAEGGQLVPGSYSMTNDSAEIEYEYEIDSEASDDAENATYANVAYSSSDLSYINTYVIIDSAYASSNYYYEGDNYSDLISKLTTYGVSSSSLTAMYDKLYFYLPSGVATLYSVSVDSASRTYVNYTLSSSAAKMGKTVTFTFSAAQYYEFTSSTQPVYYVSTYGSSQTTTTPTLADGYLSLSDGTYTLSITVAGDTVIYINGEEIEYTVTYADIDDNSGSDSVTIGATQSLTLADEPTKSGYSFEGWLSASNSTVYDAGYNFGQITQDETFTAQWTEVDYSVVFLGRDGSYLSVEVGNYGDTFTTPAGPSIDHYAFLGWKASSDTSDSAVTVLAGATVTFTGNETYTAVYEEGDPISVTITVKNTDDEIDSTVGSVTTSATDSAGTAIDVSTLAETDILALTFTPADGYTLSKFIVTYTDGSGMVCDTFTYTASSVSSISGDTYSFVLPNYDVSVVVYYAVEDYTITYMNVSDISGTNDNPTSYNIDSSFTLTDVEREDYEFDGWFDVDGNQVTEVTYEINGSTVLGDLVLVAQWTACVTEYDYTITINQGITHGTVEVTSVTAPDDTTVVKYPQQTSVTDYAITADEGDLVTIHVTADTGYKMSLETVTVNGEETEVSSLKYINTSNLSDVSYLYNGTSRFTEGDITFYMPANSIVITVEFEAIVYNINYIGGYDVNDNPSTYTVESDTIVLNDPELEGFTFVKWVNLTTNDDVTQIESGSTGNISLGAVWESNREEETAATYSITINDTSNGTVTSSASTASEGERVTLYVTAADGYMVSSVTFVGSSSSSTTALSPSTVTQLSTSLSKRIALSDTIVIDAADNPFADDATETSDGEYVFTMPADDVVVTVSFTYIEYTITYIDGGTHSNPSSYTVVDSITLTDATKTGYDFAGWYDELGNKVTGISAGTTGDLIFTGKWTASTTTTDNTDHTDTSTTDTSDAGETDGTSSGSTSTNTAGTTVSTGDDNNIQHYAMLSIVSFIILMLALFYEGIKKRLFSY